MTGKIAEIKTSWETGKPVLSLEINEVDILRSQYDKYRGCEKLSIELKQYRKKRSLDANSYYWVLVTKLADRLKESNNFIHSLMLRRYGQLEIIDGKPIYIVLPDTEETEKEVEESEKFHLKPTSQIKAGKDGQNYRTYMMLRGSRYYDSREMARLIDGIVSECHEQDIETIPPAEIERMMHAYAKAHDKVHAI